MATQYVDIIGEGFVQGVPGTFANCRVYYDGSQILHIGALYVDWPTPPPPARTGVSVTVTAFGAAGNATADDTLPIQNAINAVAAIGGGTVSFPPGTYLTGNQTLASNVHLRGEGIGATIIKLKNGTNADLFSAFTSSINIGGTSGTGSVTGVQQFAISNMTLDGNQANQLSGTSYPLRFYGVGYLLENLVVKNGYSGGILCDWNAGNPSNHIQAAIWKNVTVTDCNGIGIEMAGPSDSQWTNVIAQLTGSHNFHLGPNAGGLQATNCHGWGANSGAAAVSWLLEGTGNFINCEGESAPYAQVVILANRVQWIGGRIFAGGQGGTGFQIGQTAGGSPYSGSVNQSGGLTTAVTPQDHLINTLITDIVSSFGSIWFANDGGGKIVTEVNQTTQKYFTGTFNSKTTIEINGTGLTSDGTAGKSSTQILPSKAFRGFCVTDPTFGDVFNVDTYDHQFQILSNAQIKIYSDQYSTVSMVLNNTGNGEILLGNSGSLYSGSGVPSNGLGSNGDYYFRTGTPGTANQRIYVKSAGTWVGIV